MANMVEFPPRKVKGMVLEYSSGNISAKLARSRKTLVQNVSFCLAEGKSLALIGETGSGKTMTALSIMGLLPRNVEAKSGCIRFQGKALSRKGAVRPLLGDRIVYIPQNGLEFLNPSRKIRHHLYDNLKKIGVPRQKLEETAKQKLTLAGLLSPEDVLDKYPFQLSGGMAQRVTIAISACSNAALIIADEPTNGLDDAAKQRFMELICQVFPDAAKLIITHDIALAALCDETLVLCGGRMMEKGDSEAVLNRPKNGYTQALIGSLVKNGMRQTPVLRRDEGFCPFYRRCSAASDRCREAMAHCSDAHTEWWCNQP